MSNFCVRLAIDNEAVGDVAITPTSITPVLSTGASIIHDPLCSAQSYVLQPAYSAPLTLDQGLELGWLVGGVWLSVYAVVFIVRYLWSEIGAIDNDPHP